MTYKVLVIGDSGTGKTSLRTQFLYKTFSFQYKSTIGANFVTKEIALPSKTVSSINVASATHHRYESSYDTSGGSSVPQSFHSINAFPDWPTDISKSRTMSASPSMSSLRTVIPTSKVSLCVWDTSGQEKFNALSPTFYRGADCAILVYDLMNPDSLTNLASHHAQFLRFCGSDDPVVVVVGNKLDAVPAQQARAVFGVNVEASRITSQREVEQLIASLTRSDEIQHFKVSAKLGTHVEDLFLRVAELCMARKERDKLVHPFDVEDTRVSLTRQSGSKCC